MKKEISVPLMVALVTATTAVGFCQEIKKMMVLEEVLQQWKVVKKGSPEYQEMVINYARLRGNPEGTKDICEKLGDLDVANRNRNNEPLLDLFEDCVHVANVIQQTYEHIDQYKSVAIDPQQIKEYNKKVNMVINLTNHLDKTRGKDAMAKLLPSIDKALSEIARLEVNIVVQFIMMEIGKMPPASEHMRKLPAPQQGWLKEEQVAPRVDDNPFEEEEGEQEEQQEEEHPQAPKVDRVDFE